MSEDIINACHLSLLQRAAELVRVVVGLLTDEAISTHKQARC